MKKNHPPTGNRRPTPTIDLKAEEVKKDAPEATDTAEDAAKASASEPTGPATATTTATASKSDIPGDRTTGDKASTDKPASEKPAAETAKGGASAVGTGVHRPTGGKGDTSKTADTGSPAGKQPAPAAAAKSGFGSLAGHLFTGIVGAVLGILGMSFANNQNLLPDAFDLTGGTYRTQIIALEDKLSALEARSSNSGLDSLGGRINALAERLDKSETTLGSISGDTSLADKVAALEGTIGNLEAAAKTGDGGQLAGLTAVTKELTRANDQADRLNGEFIKMRDEQSVFRQDLASLRSGQADFHIVTARIEDEIAKLKTTDAKLTADVGRPPDVSAQINPLSDAISTLRTDVNGLMDRESGSRAEGRNIALALSLGELKRAVNAGEPYRAELDRVKPHAPRNLELAPLQNYADNGIITMKALRDQFAPLSNTALAAETTAASGSLVDQLMANAKALVQVRPTGLVEGDDTSAILARIEYRLDRADLVDALKEADKLQGDPLKVMQPWLERAKARLAADSLLVTLEDRIRNSLAGVSTQ